MEAKNLELAQMTKKYDAGYEEGKNISPFTMVVKGAIDAGKYSRSLYLSLSLLLILLSTTAVNGGIENYTNAFVNPEYLTGNLITRFYIYFYSHFFDLENREDEPLVKQLLQSIQAHIVLLEKGLNVHSAVCGPSFAPLQEVLERTPSFTFFDFRFLSFALLLFRFSALSLFAFCFSFQFSLTFTPTEQFQKTKTNVASLSMPAA